MPFIAGLLSSIFTGTLVFFAQFMTRKLALVIAGIAAVSAVTIAFFTALNGLLLAIAVAVPQPIVTGYHLFMPSNLDECITAIVTAKTLAWAYGWNLRIIEWKLF